MPRPREPRERRRWERTRGEIAVGRWLILYRLTESEREAVKQYVRRNGWTWRAHGPQGEILALDVPASVRARVGAALAGLFPHAVTVRPKPSEIAAAKHATDWDVLRREIRNLPLDWSVYNPEWEEERTRLDKK